MTWAVVVVSSVGCYLLKLGGMVVPPAWISGRRSQQVTSLIPVALLSGIVALQTFADGTALGVDARLVGLLVAVAAVRRRAPFPVVVIGAAAATALVRALG